MCLRQLRNLLTRPPTLARTLRRSLSSGDLPSHALDFQHVAKMDAYDLIRLLVLLVKDTFVCTRGRHSQWSPGFEPIWTLEDSLKRRLLLSNNFNDMIYLIRSCLILAAPSEIGPVLPWVPVGHDDKYRQATPRACPIQRLPDEILGRIISFASGAHDHGPVLSRSHQKRFDRRIDQRWLQSLALVCKKWEPVVRAVGLRTLCLTRSKQVSGLIRLFDDRPEHGQCIQELFLDYHFHNRVSDVDLYEYREMWMDGPLSARDYSPFTALQRQKDLNEFAVRDPLIPFLERCSALSKLNMRLTLDYSSRHVETDFHEILACTDLFSIYFSNHFICTPLLN
jgi:hypothetical protein